MIRLVALILLAALYGCSTIGDGKILWIEPHTAYGKAVVRQGALARAYVEQHPEVKQAAIIALRIACNLGKCALVADAVEVIKEITAAVDAGRQVSDEEKMIADELGKLDAALQGALLVQVVQEQ